MEYRVILAKSAKKDIKKLAPLLRGRLRTKITFHVEQENPLAFASPLKEPADAQYRFRVGNYRVLFDVEGDTIVILRVQHRREVYR